MVRPSRRLTGRGLHNGSECSLTLSRHDGPVRLGAGGALHPRASLDLVRTDAGVCVATPSGERIDLVEHLFAALGGLSIQQGIELTVDGGEVPLVDGAAHAFARDLQVLRARPDPPALRIRRHARLSFGETVYEFEPGDGVELAVTVQFGPLPPQTATWGGDEQAFLSRIAAARTFGFARDRTALESRGRALGVDLNHVLVLDDEGNSLPGCAPMQPDELAHHKLLDLIGDSYLYGGPPLGSIRAWYPGHTASHTAFARGLLMGVLEYADSDFECRRSIRSEPWSLV